MTEKAYIDGRDLRATPPLTLARLNVWAGLPRRLNRVVGQIKHGKRVRVMEFRHCEFERRDMARIRRWFLTGWVPASWLSWWRREPVGTLYEPTALAQRSKWRRRRAD